ncbi:MAG: hypothetical protein RML46_02210 [Anaerolineae bacterium]|nr:hypothetical protein [Anaerolineae bacterium]MDW8067710.1 hypothetical protein [Anaerolineae bacterium]
MSTSSIPVGRILQASNQGFVVGCKAMQREIPAFGSFVRADIRSSGTAVYGLIYNVALRDDEFVRHIVIAEPTEEVVRDQQENRQVPIEVSVLTVGCRVGDRILHCIPPQPPVTMDFLYQCPPEEIWAFTSRLDYFRLILNARDVPADELLAASLGFAAAARPSGERDAFLLEAGRELARLLGSDLLRLDGLLRRIAQIRDVS